MDAHYDIAVVGAGVVGAATACALAPLGLRMALLDAAAPAPMPSAVDETQIDPRVFAITCASQRILTHIGAWAFLPVARLGPFREMRVWDEYGAIHFDSAELGADTLGHIIEQRVLLRALFEALAVHPNIDVLSATRVEGLEHVAGELPADTRRDPLKLQLSTGRCISARLVIAADGAQSQVRQLAGLRVSGWAYHQSAVVATVRSALPHRETAWQRFLPSGPLAFLPLHDGRCSIVWSTTPEHAQTLVSMSDADFCRALQDGFQQRLGEILDTTPRLVFPLALQHAPRYVAPRIALVGDAAHTIHPLAGQGVNLGLLDAAILAEVLMASHRQGRDIGGLAALRRYERGRKSDNLMMMGVMDGMKRLFDSTLPGVPPLRRLGLNFTNQTPSLKALFMRQAMGLSGDLPRLAQAVFP